ncbi:MAG: CoA transferase [Chloroflexota bacterium]
MSLPLEGINVLEFGAVFAGPATVMHLADQGANVIKVEPPEGDSARRSAPVFLNGLSLAFLTLNRNKRSIVLNLRQPKAMEVVHRLTKWTDAVVINMKTGSPEKLGIGYKQLSAINPRLIYVSMTYAGERGPEAELPGIDLITQARVGILEHHRHPDRPPVTSRIWNFDMSVPMVASYGVLLALWERQRTGKGQKIEVSLLQTALMLQSIQMTRATPIDQEPLPPAKAVAFPSRFSPDNLPNIYLCKDSRYLFFSLPGERWQRLCHTIGLHELADNPKYEDPNNRNKYAKELGKILADRLATRPAEEWEKVLKADGQACSVVRDMTEVYDDPQVIANEMITQFEQPDFHPVLAVNTPLKLSATAGENRFRRPVPLLGEHTFEVLQELKYSEDEISEMAAAEVLG